MRHSRWWPGGQVIGVVVAGCLLAGCSSGPAVLAAPGPTCDVDPSSEEAKSTNERVGGRRTDSYVVRFAQTTRLGVVALVEGDVRAAHDDLTTGYGVALVAELEQDPDPEPGAGPAAGFAQVRELVEAACGPGGAP